MTISPIPSSPPSRRAPSRRAFTLLELLVVLAIIAVVGSAIAVTYGRKNIDDAKDKMTLHEMQEIKKTFLRFEMDNARRLDQVLADHEGDLLESDDLDGFTTSPEADDPIYARMAFYERYGLWFLMEPTIYEVPGSDRDDLSDPAAPVYLFPEFEDYNSTTGEGWNGPYLDVTQRGKILQGEIAFPQIADKHEGIYRLLYFEHEHPDNPDDYPTYRRLLLIAPRGNAAWDEHDELLLESGNRRGGSDEQRFNLETGTFENVVDDEDGSVKPSPFFILELLNMDKRPRP